MILKFPDLQTLQLALTAGVVPATVAQGSVVAGFDDLRQLWIECPSSLPRNVLSELRKLNVFVAKAMGAAEFAKFGSWLELVPLQPDPRPPEKPEQLPVLFELSQREDLARIVFEILRLGNDRQSFRWLGNDDDTRALLRVVGPPYYSLLRAIDRNGKESAPVAYVERAPKVWVELGQTHPLLDLLKPPKGKLLFLRAPQSWTLLDDAPFQDIYEVMEFALPDRPVAWTDQALPGKLNVPLSLRAGGPLTGAQMWVLHDDAEAELNRFVQNSNEQLLTSLAFAVGERDGQKTIVVRALYSRSAPPELVLNATAYRQHLRLPNLFLPLGMQLQPHLRRDVVRKLLAEDTEHVVWLVPGDNGSFTPQRLPENAFRPLTDWVAYVLDQSTESLHSWMQALRFDFESFICDDEEGKPTKPDVPKEKRRKDKKDRRDAADDAFATGLAIDSADRTGNVQGKTADMDFAAAFAHAEPNVLQQQLKAAEERFVRIEGDLDAPERRNLWPELANLNAALRVTDDAGLCWLAAMWFQDKIPAQWAQAYLQVESSAVRVRPELKLPGNHTWIAGAADGRDPDWDALLSAADATVADLRALAACLVWAGVQPKPPRALLDRLNPVQRFLEKHERLLPVRAVWLAWSHLVQMSRGDVLALARTRDRLLERLFQDGLRPENDLVSFLRFSGQPVNLRYRGMRQWLSELCELAHMWAEENTRPPLPDGKRREAELPAPMKGYIDLLFAFGLARLGEADAARQLLQRATMHLTEQGPVHTLLLQGFEYRVRQALDGKPHGGPLPDDYYLGLKRLGGGNGQWAGLEPYAAERMQCEMRILDPDHVIDPYRHIKGAVEGLDRTLAELADLRDPNEVAARVEALWLQAPKGTKGNVTRVRVLSEALNLGPRINEDFSRKMLDRAVVLLDTLSPALGDEELRHQVELLERAMFVAAHFDRVECIQPLVTRFKKVLQFDFGALGMKPVIKAANKCFRGLRKVGMRNEIEDLLTWMKDVVLGGRDLTKFTADELARTPEDLQILLELAGGWYYFGRDRQAETVLNAVLAVLYKEVLLSKDQTPLARSYIAALGQGPVESAQTRLVDLFTNLRCVRDNMTTAKFYNRHQLELIETVVLAVTHEDFTLGANARRWLEDDEFLVRKRIHQDVRVILRQD